MAKVPLVKYWVFIIKSESLIDKILIWKVSAAFTINGMYDGGENGLGL